MNKLNRVSPSDRPIKVLQFGGGNFLRAYFDWMIDILNEQTDFNGDVIIVKPTQHGRYNLLRESEGLFHVITSGIKDGKLLSEPHLVKCVQSIIHPYLAWTDYLQSAHNPTIRFIISNTTEAGIRFNPKDSKTTRPPTEFPAKLTRWLYERWQHFSGQATKACIFLPCELIENNGAQLKDCILQYANHWSYEEAFQEWIENHNLFCNTLVDRIVPGYPIDRIEEINKTLNVIDPLVVEAEPYHLLVIEGAEQIKEELPFHKTNLNVVFTNDLNPYRQLKVRILNGAHTAMVPIGFLAGVETVREAVEDEVVGRFIKELLQKEILPTLSFPEEEKIQYANDVLDRFKNPFIKHRLIDISLNSIAKFKSRLLPTLIKYIQQNNKAPTNIIKALAALIVFYKDGKGNQEVPFKAGEEVIRFFNDKWKQWEINKDTRSLCIEVLSNQSFWGLDLNSFDILSDILYKEVDNYLNN